MSDHRTKITAKGAVTRNRDWAEPFLLSLAEKGIVGVACAEAFVSRQTVYQRRRDDGAFAARWKDALEEAADMLESEARRRAEKGVDEPVIYQGQVAGNWVDADGNPCKQTHKDAKFVPIIIKKYSNSLLTFLLTAARPKKFRQNVKMQHGGKVDATLTVTAAKPAMERLRKNPEAYANAKALAARITNDN